jgi:type I restriction enzyme S subunit
MKWPTPALGQIATITGGSTPSRTQAEYWNGSIPWLTPTGLPMPGKGIADVIDTAGKITEEGLAAISAQLLPVGTVLFSSRATIGKLGISRVPLATNQGFANFIPKEFVDAKYLAYCLLHYTPEIAALAGSTTFKEVTKTALKKFKVPLPALSEQRRIVEILDQADALRKKRAEADAKAARILPALFYKMFGDPARNPKGWPNEEISNLFEVVGGGTPSKTIPEYWTGNIPWVSPKDMKCDVIQDTEDHITLEAVSNSATRLVRQGSILLVYRSGILAHSFPVAIAGCDLTINQDIKAITSKGNVSNEYLYGMLISTPSLGLSCVKKGATVHNIDGSRFMNLKIGIPPEGLQKSFAIQLHALLKHKANRRVASARIDNLFSVLLHRAFTGDLTTKWREAHMKELLVEMEQQVKALEGTNA